MARKLGAHNSHIISLGLSRFAHFVQAQGALTNSKRWPSCTPFSDMRRSKMAIKRRLICPEFLDVNQPTIRNVIGIAVFNAAVFSTAGIDHMFHNGPR